jgi:hypothetical protein
MSCEFYGYSASTQMKILATQGGNQCPVIVHRFSPCEMELRGEAPDQTRCPLYTLGRRMFEDFERWELIPPKEPPSNLREAWPFVTLIEFTAPTTETENQLCWFLQEHFRAKHVEFQISFESDKQSYRVRQDHLCLATTILDAGRAQTGTTK